MFRRWMTLCCLVLTLLSAAAAQLTRPEWTNDEETSRYEDVIAFLDSLPPNPSVLKFGWLGYSPAGRRLPMAVYGDVPDIRPETVRRSGKLVVYVQGNIHAGEVEGKEAMLELLRELARGGHAEWRRRLIVIIVPIFNADGNENISLFNRPYQYGPVAGMGQRANGQGLDLNRDHTKLESPEVRAFVSLLDRYDPHIVVDLHTTNGSFHGYHITYSHALHPALDGPLDAFQRTSFFPAVHKRMTARKWRVHRYGDYLERTPAGKPGYFYWAHEPRYNSNYVGLRNRIAVLSEAYSYVTFRTRIDATKALVEAVLDEANANSRAIRAAVAAADERAVQLPTTDSLAVRGEIVESSPAESLLLAPVREVRNPYSGQTMYLMKEESLRTVVTAEFYGTRALRSAAVPEGYLIPDSLRAVADLLRDHGIRIDTVQQRRTVTAGRFLITADRLSEREFQKHRMRTVEGRYETVTLDVPAGTLFVPLDQPLSRLAMQLLEPESEDGVVAWNVMDRYRGNGSVYSIVTIIPKR